MSLLLLFHPGAGGAPPTPPAEEPAPTWREVGAGGGVTWGQAYKIMADRMEQDDEEIFMAVSIFLSQRKH